MSWFVTRLTFCSFFHMNCLPNHSFVFGWSIGSCSDLCFPSTSDEGLTLWEKSLGWSSNKFDDERWTILDWLVSSLLFAFDEWSVALSWLRDFSNSGRDLRWTCFQCFLLYTGQCLCSSPLECHRAWGFLLALRHLPKRLLCVHMRLTLAQTVGPQMTWGMGHYISFLTNFSSQQQYVNVAPKAPRLLLIAAGHNCGGTKQVTDLLLVLMRLKYFVCNQLWQRRHGEALNNKLTCLVAVLLWKHDRRQKTNFL